MFFNSINEMNWLKKEIDRLLKKKMSSIYLKVIVEEKWHTQSFDFKSFKSVPIKKCFY